eukprot:7624530-Alexandrium_andersonii.AAC.1
MTENKNLQNHLHLNASSIKTYADLRNVVVSWSLARHPWNPKPKKAADDGGQAPMDIGAITGKGKHKGKDGGKGAKGKHGKDKGKSKGKDHQSNQGKLKVSGYCSRCGRA